jgi:hypothetical protein
VTETGLVGLQEEDPFEESVLNSRNIPSLPFPEEQEPGIKDMHYTCAYRQYGRILMEYIDAAAGSRTRT